MISIAISRVVYFIYFRKIFIYAGNIIISAFSLWFLWYWLLLIKKKNSTVIEKWYLTEKKPELQYISFFLVERYSLQHPFFYFIKTIISDDCPKHRYKLNSSYWNKNNLHPLQFDSTSVVLNTTFNSTKLFGRWICLSGANHMAVYDFTIYCMYYSHYPACTSFKC